MTLMCEAIKRADTLCSMMLIPMSPENHLDVKAIYTECQSKSTTELPLVSASRQGFVHLVTCFIECAKQTNTDLHSGETGGFQKFLWLRNDSNETALDVAIQEGHIEIAKLLLENASLECLVSERNHKGKLPVSMLTDTEYDEFILSILEKASSTAVDPPASTYIRIDEENLQQESSNDYSSVKMDPKSYPLSNISETRKSLEKLDQGTLELTPNKNTILHLVSKIGDLKYAHDILVKHSSLLSRHNSDGETPAYVAAREGHVDILAYMISYFKTKNDDIVSFVERSIDKNTALHIAIQNHHVAVVFLLMKEIPELVNHINDCYETPIYLAAERNYDHLLLLMLNKSRKIKVFGGPNGKTALHAAAISGSTECIKYLLREGEWIDQHTRDAFGWTALHYAVRHNNLLAASRLLDSDPSIGYAIVKEDDIDTSAMHLAASRGYCEILKVLMSCCPGCLELVDGNGKNVFHVAVENNQTEVIELIYQDESYTSLVNQKDKNGNTPIHLLMASDHEIIEVAMDYRLNMNATNNEELTPLDVASSNEKRDKLIEGIAMGKKVDRLSDTDKKTREEDVSKSRENVLLVATLIATASFAAAFTVPGGFNGNEGSRQGMPILLRKAAFQAFIVTNTLAFSFSCSVLFKHLTILLFKEDENEIRDAIGRMNILTLYAMLAMVVAFAMGIYVVLTPYQGFAIFLCILALISPVLVDSLTDMNTYNQGRIPKSKLRWAVNNLCSNNNA